MAWGVSTVVEDETFGYEGNEVVVISVCRVGKQ